MSDIDDVTPEVQEAIEELKRRTIHDLTPRLLEDEFLFYRFLKARDFNVKNAEAMLRQHLLDRKLYRTEEILKEYIPDEQFDKYAGNSFLGFDKEGASVRYVDFGRIDHKGFLTLHDFRKCALFFIYHMEDDIERMKLRSKNLGLPPTKMVFIVNVDTLNFFQATFKKSIEYSINGVKLYQDNYPERVKAIYVINASFYSNLAFSFVKHVIAAPLLKKIHFFGTTGWQEVLLNAIDAEELPAFLGGNRTDPDGNEFCNSFIIHGIKVPKELYSKKNRKSIKHESYVKKLVVTRSSSSEIEFHIIEPGSHLEWEFETKNRDICFGLYYKDDSKRNFQMEELIPKQRIETEFSSEVGLYKCDKTGTYLFVFDNSYSWLHSKEIYYRIGMIKPQENKIKTLKNG